MSRSALKRQLEKTNELVSALPASHGSAKLPERKVKQSRTAKRPEVKSYILASFRSLGMMGLLLLLLGTIALAASLYQRNGANQEAHVADVTPEATITPQAAEIMDAAPEATASPAAGPTTLPAPDELTEDGLNKSKLLGIISQQ